MTIAILVNEAVQRSQQVALLRGDAAACLTRAKKLEEIAARYEPDRLNEGN